MIFNSREDLTSKIREIQPDIMVIGSDWKDKDVVGQEYVGQLKFFERIGNYSTTSILENIK